MTGLQRTKAIWAFEQPDHYPVPPIHAWRETLDCWHAQGLPPYADPNAVAGINGWDVHVPPINFGLHPAFEIKILEQNDRHVVLRDELGVTKRMRRSDYDVSGGYLAQSGQTGAMSHWLAYPVTDIASWEELYHTRLLPDMDGRFAQGLLSGQNGELIPTDRAILIHNFPLLGGLGTLRQLMGYEEMVYAMHDTPELIDCIVADLCSFWLALFTRVFASGIRVDGVVFFEDMCSARAPLLSPQMFERFFGKAYRTLNAYLRDNGVFWREVDSDGNIAPMIATWRELGINTVSPCQARCNFRLEDICEAFPDMVFKGGIDKEVLAEDHDAIRAELTRVFAIAKKRGGVQPLPDHSLPPHVPFDNVLFYADEYRRLGGCPAQN